MSKTFTAKICLDEEQILGVIAAYFDVPKDRVVLNYTPMGGIDHLEIDKEIEVPDKPNTEFIPIPVNPPHDWWNDDWWKNPILHPVVTWCHNEATTITGGKSITDATLHAEWINADALTNTGTTEGKYGGL